MPTLQAVAVIQLGVPGGGPIRNKVRLQPSRIAAKRAANDLLHFALVQVNARTKHVGKLKAKG